MVIRSTIAGVAGILMLVAAGTHPVAAQGSCPAGCDGATNWTGFWLGAGLGVSADMIGHDWVETTTGTGTLLGSGNDDSRGSAGLFGTVGAGYDWQVRDRWVLGAFTDFDFGKSKHTETDQWFAAGAGNSGKAGWEIERNRTWTIGARVGLLTSNTSMVYGLVGYSRTSLDVTVFEENDTPESLRTSGSLDFSGLVLGVGLEQDLGNGFSLKGEYRYTNYGSESFGSHVELDATKTESDEFDLDSHSVRLTLAYKFGRRSDAIEEVSYKDIPPAPSYSAPYK